MGKYTIAKALATGQDCHHLVIDSHYINNVIFPLVGTDGTRPLGPAVWTKVDQIRSVVLDTIKTMSPPEWSFVFTNVLTADNPADRGFFAGIEILAEVRNSLFVPVTLVCEVEELARRMATPTRAERFK